MDRVSFAAVLTAGGKGKFGFFLFAVADSVTLLSSCSEVQGGDRANTGATSGYVGSAEVKETFFLLARRSPETLRTLVMLAPPPSRARIRLTSRG